MDNKTARQDLETVLRVEDLALGSIRKLRVIQDWLRAEAAVAQQAPDQTPAARWREAGEPDPHDGKYEGERASLCKGDMTDDELANEVYLYPNIGNLTAAKERIRWLSRKLETDRPAKPQSKIPVGWPTPEMVLAYNVHGTNFPAEPLPEGPPRNLDVEAFRAALCAAPTNTSEAEPFQDRAAPWLLECFGEMIARDKEERNHRFLEEALELVQACDCTADEAHKLVDYVFGRPAGEKSQEVGGVHVTLAALCLAQDIDGQAAAEAELSRITQPEMVERIREKQKRKPSMSPLPGVYPERPSAPADRGAE
ncbi:hypothetical protein [Marinobacter sp.]|uniref:hypothetical protein n=1 Tax=Marinobacter sp. TaxID=50741 RepID=UPI003561E9F8